MSPLTGWAVLSGALLGLGLWITCARLPVLRRTTFAERVAPQLRSVDASSRLLRSDHLGVTPFGSIERVLRPAVAEAVAVMSSFGAGKAALERRLAQAGLSSRVTEFRSEQILWAGLAFGVGSVAAIGAASAGKIPPPLAVLLSLAAGVAGFLGREFALTATIRRRHRRILAEFPAIADMFALAVGAGETAAGALDRLAGVSAGALAEEFSRVTAETRAGATLVGALRAMAVRVDLAPISRFVDGLIVAIERGTPLSDVLRAQAQDVRDAAKRDLMEAAGRKEIGMMVPLVFGILPLTILFAVFPGFASIALGP
ncbi:type II secretion system F family protein [Sinomonas humi]|uniref:Type II secretion system protein F n=1 Tax=Sinomonas humi TaxID=1338436 RepID=A0A0B2AMW5_9MICC|nr:type II secretion system F family protein [Sinomonas humi]KHL04986.1 type II secretion system protein F [Sinomonas humi]